MKRILIILLLILQIPLSSQTFNPCLENGFEGLPSGTLSASSWTGSSFGSSFCSPSVVFNPSSLRTIVEATPITDAAVNNVLNSPFTGSNVLHINRAQTASGARVSKTFTVTNSNFMFNYAYKGYLEGSHGPCDDASLIFKFYDCSNVLIPALTYTINSFANPDAAFWIPGTGLQSNIYTPNWVIHQANLSAYIGTCVRFEAFATTCSFTGHKGYCYLDTECSNNYLTANGTYIGSSSSYTSCSSTATLSTSGNFSSYLWQGPPLSGVSGSTLSSVTTTVPGSYTLTVNTGSNTYSQSVNLNINNLPSANISGNVNLCPNQSSTLQLSGTGVTSYSWGPGFTTSSLVVSPPVSTTYAVTYTNSFNCSFTRTVAVIRHSNPSVVFTTPASYVCIGGNVAISVVSVPGITVLWSNGSTGAQTSVSPTVNSVYSVSLTSQFGCTASGTHSVIVWPKPQINIISNSPVCSGKQVNLQASGASTYSWSNGLSGASISFTPFIGSTYIVTGTNSNGCVNTNTTSIVINPLPVILNGNTIDTICYGVNSSIWVNSSNSYYIWSNGATGPSLNIAPTINTIYNVTVSNTFNCKSTATKSVVVIPLPTVQIGADEESICIGDQVSLYALGSSLVSFLWSNGAVTNSITVSPNQNSTYSINATGINGCNAEATILLTVNECTGVKEEGLKSKELTIYPNPAVGRFTLASHKYCSVIIYDETGREIQIIELNEGNHFSHQVNNLTAGIYIVRNGATFTKLLIE